MKIQTVFGEIDVGKTSKDDVKCYSPLLAEKMAYAISKSQSAAEASQMLDILASVQLTPEEIDQFARQFSKNFRGKPPK